MALKDKATFIAAIDTAATALTAAWKNDLATTDNISDEFRTPFFPLREVEKMLTLDDAGTFTADDNYIEESYAGQFPSKGTGNLKKITNPSEAPTSLFSRVEAAGFPSVANGEETASPGETAVNSVSLLFLSKNDAGGGDQTALIASLNGTNIRLVDEGNPSNFVDITNVTIQDVGASMSIQDPGGNIAFAVAWPALGVNVNYESI